MESGEPPRPGVAGGRSFSSCCFRSRRGTFQLTLRDSLKLLGTEAGTQDPPPPALTAHSSRRLSMRSRSPCETCQIWGYPCIRLCRHGAALQPPPHHTDAARVGHTRDYYNGPLLWRPASLPVFHIRTRTALLDWTKESPSNRSTILYHTVTDQLLPGDHTRRV